MKFREVLTIAHNVDDEKTERTEDVTTTTAASFESLLLSKEVIKGLQKAGFKRPSPVQLMAIPVGKLGLDLVVQAKSGTGKTCVFSVLALETIAVDNAAAQALIVAPTREIANQIFSTIQTLGSKMKQAGLIAGLFIGGTNYDKDVGLIKNRCPIVIGTPGRLCQLVKSKNLDLDTIRLFVLDEADKLMEDDYRGSINYLFSQMPTGKQVAVFSATYPHALDTFLSEYMRSPTMVRQDSRDVQLIGIKQYFVLTNTALKQETSETGFQKTVEMGFQKSDGGETGFQKPDGGETGFQKFDAETAFQKPAETALEKTAEITSQVTTTDEIIEENTNSCNVQINPIKMKCNALCQLLKRVNYSQCLVFCNYTQTCNDVVAHLKESGLTALLMTGAVMQTRRFEIMKKLTNFKTRLVVSTDLTARGIDAPNINLVVNLEIPHDSETYFHRIGRAGRFGGCGAAVTFASEGVDDKRFFMMGLMSRFKVKRVQAVPSFPTDLCSNIGFWESLPNMNFREYQQNSGNTGQQPSVMFYGRPSPHRDTENRLRRNRNSRKIIPTDLPRPDPNRLSPEAYIQKFVNSELLSVGATTSQMMEQSVNLEVKHVYSREIMLSLDSSKVIEKNGGPKDECAQENSLNDSESIHNNGVEYLSTTDNLARMIFDKNLNIDLVEENLCYDRQTLIDIRNSLPDGYFTASNSPAASFHEILALSSTKNQRQDFSLAVKNLRKIILNNSKNNNNNKNIKKEESEAKAKANIVNKSTIETESSKKLAPFVPSRLKGKKKYYMRGEMLTIRDGINSEKTCLQLANNQQFDINREPFLCAFALSKTVQGKTSEDWDKEEVVDEKTGSDLAATAEISSHIKKYTRYEILQLIKSSPRPHQWLDYALAKKWDTSMVPFCQDMELRGTHRQQLLVCRAREKHKRQLALEQRKLVEEEKIRLQQKKAPAQKLKPELEFSVRLTRGVNKDYRNKIVSFVKNYKANGQNDGDTNGEGPVVMPCHSPKKWTEMVQHNADIVQNSGKKFEQGMCQTIGEQKSSASESFPKSFHTNWADLKGVDIEFPVVQLDSEEEEGQYKEDTDEIKEKFDAVLLQTKMETLFKHNELYSNKHYPYRNRTVQYDWDSMLAIWTDVVRLNFNPRKLSWHSKLKNLDLYVAREYSLENTEEELSLVRGDRKNGRVCEKVEKTGVSTTIVKCQVAVQTDELVEEKVNVIIDKMEMEINKGDNVDKNDIIIKEEIIDTSFGQQSVQEEDIFGTKSQMSSHVIKVESNEVESAAPDNAEEIVSMGNEKGGEDEEIIVVLNNSMDEDIGHKKTFTNEGTIKKFRRQRSGHNLKTGKIQVAKTVVDQKEVIKDEKLDESEQKSDKVEIFLENHPALDEGAILANQYEQMLQYFDNSYNRENANSNQILKEYYERLRAGMAGQANMNANVYSQLSSYTIAMARYSGI